MDASPAKKRKGIYKFVIREDVVYSTAIQGVEFNNDWLTIQADGLITVKGSYGDGYAWDGCTPKWNVMDLFLFGTPDGRVIVNTEKPITYYASLIHDILLQFKAEIGITRRQADDIFLHYLGDFDLKYVYYYAVRGYGALVNALEKLLVTNQAKS